MADYNDTNRTNIDDFLTVRGFGGGYGYMGGGGGSLYTGNNVLAAEAHANGTATKEAIDCNSRQFTAGLQRVSDQAEESRRISSFDAINKNITDSEFRSLDRQRDIERLINQNAKDAAECCCEVKAAVAQAAKEAAECCCEAKLQQCKDTAELKALIIKENSQTRDLMNSSALAAAQAELTQLKTIDALRGHHGHR